MTLIINDYLSTKLRALSLGSIILVVFLHSHNGEVKLASGDLTGEQSYFVLFVENFFSKGIALIAAPFFFAISGFLFYKSYDFTWSDVVKKIKGRFKSLIVPYLFWSLFGLMFIWFLQVVPWSRFFFTRELIADYSISKLLYTIILDPVPYQLWFVRDLIMLVIFSPLIGYLTKSIRVVWLVLLILLWTASGKTFEFFSNEALLFFTIGCALAFDKAELINQKLPKYLSYLLLVSWLLVVLFATYLITFNRGIFISNALSKVGILIGIMSVWSFYDHVDHRRVAKYSSLFGYSFFIFVFHEPLLTILKKGLFFLLGKTNFSSLLIYLVAPLTTIGICMLLSYFLRSRTPRFYNFTTGGR